MKKKIIALLLILVLTAGMAGCDVLDKFRLVDNKVETGATDPKDDTDITDAPSEPTKTPAEPTAEPADDITDAPADDITDEPVAEPDIRFLTTDFDGNGWDETCFFENKITMINLWAYWCGPCVGELPDLEQLNKDYADKGLQIIGISLKEEEAENRETVKELGITYPNLFYTEEFDEYMDTGYYPTTIFVDSEGQVLGNAAIGSREYKDWAKIIEDLLKE